jgi:hypothetical protein
MPLLNQRIRRDFAKKSRDSPLFSVATQRGNCFIIAVRHRHPLVMLLPFLGVSSLNLAAPPGAAFFLCDGMAAFCG